MLRNSEMQHYSLPWQDLPSAFAFLRAAGSPRGHLERQSLLGTYGCHMPHLQ